MFSSNTSQVSNAANYIEDVFSTWLYTGNGSTQTITNGIDLSGKGGLVWIKNRASTNDYVLSDTARGATNTLSSNSTAAQTNSSGNDVSSFSATGFSVGGNNNVNATGQPSVSWTFRKQPKFFDVVTYTGNGTAGRTVAHNLGSVPGCIIVKCIDDSSFNWLVYHTSLGNDKFINLNTTSAATTGAQWYNTNPTSTVFTVNSFDSINGSGKTYVAYIFAHNAGGFGLTGTDNVISCGSATADGSGRISVNLGYEPQWLLTKSSTEANDWVIVDNLRGFTASGDDSVLSPNLSDAEIAPSSAEITSTGFNQTISVSSTLIYVAIRRGPMKTPTDATKVFMPTVYTGTNVDNRLVDTTIAPDMVWVRQRNDTVLAGMVVGDRLRGQPWLRTGGTNSGVNDPDAFDQQIFSTTEYGNAFSSMSGFWCGNDATAKLNANTTSNNHVVEAFKRAPGFFDVVCWTGTTSEGTPITVSHNLNAVPELIITKKRSQAAGWFTYHAALTAANYVSLDSSNASAAYSNMWNNTTPTSTVFTTAYQNASGDTYVAYLFASCPGVSKVFSFTGNGSSQTINCGFTGGARFVMIKRTDSTGDWYVWDSARGIVSGNDPRLSLNTTAAEVTTDDSVDTDSTGFVVNQLSATNVNVNGATYIGLAIA